jgi:hypothetical protein
MKTIEADKYVLYIYFFEIIFVNISTRMEVGHGLR